MPAYFLTWTTYGTRLAGDPRGSIDKQHNTPQSSLLKPHPKRHTANMLQLKEPPLVLSPNQRQLLNNVIPEHCAFRGWRLYAHNVRTNHIHVVLAADTTPEDVMGKLKSRCSRMLRDQNESLRRVWTAHGSTRWLNDDAAIENAINYVMMMQ
ncbi:MAG: transposase [Phycisphaeraceae bacterium]